MTAVRSRKQHRRYRKFLKQTDPAVCMFCGITADYPHFLEQTQNFTVIRNIFPYAIWDSQRVVDHLMIVPKRHADTLKDLSASEAVEFLRLLSDYESRGYSVYARAPNSRIKTIEHQHTHLIKGSGAIARLVLVLRKPYLGISL